MYTVTYAMSATIWEAVAMKSAVHVQVLMLHMKMMLLSENIVNISRWEQGIVNRKMLLQATVTLPYKST